MKDKKMNVNNNKYENLFKKTIKNLNYEEMVTTFFGSSYRPIYIADENKKLTYVNKAMCNVLGYDKQELLQMELHQIFNKESFENILKREQTELLEKGEINERVYFLTKEGNEIFGEIKITAIINSVKRLIGSRAIFHDLSERIKYSNILLESRERYQTLVENLPVGIGIISEDGKIVSANNLALGFFGYELKDLEWLTTSHFYSNPDDKDDFIHKIAFEKSVRNYEIELKRKDGTPINLLLNVKPIVYSDGNYLLAVFNDISDRKDEKFKINKEMELKYDKLKSEFFAKICCEVRIGAIIIRDLNESISDKLWDKIDFETRSYLNEIESAGSRVLRIMDLLYDMSAVNKNDKKKKIDLNYILQKSYLKYKLIADAKDIEIDIKVNTSEATVTADEYITAKIFSGIIENAVKYTTGSKVEIVMEKMDNNKLCVSFSNTGIDMSNSTKFFSLFSPEGEVNLSNCKESDLVFPFLKMYCDLNGATIYTGDEKNIESKFTIVFDL